MCLLHFIYSVCRIYKIYTPCKKEFFIINIISFDNHDFTTTFTAVLATFNNIGPGLELVGPAENFSFWSGISKYVLMFDMIAGRLELFPLLILFSPRALKDLFLSGFNLDNRKK